MEVERSARRNGFLDRTPGELVPKGDRAAVHPQEPGVQACIEIVEGRVCLD